MSLYLLSLPLLFVGPIVTPGAAQDVGVRPDSQEEGPSPSGRDLYLTSCANCHGPDGTGLSSAEVGFDLELPDFTDCRFASREPHGDWVGVAHEGGPLRGFDRMMPAFGDALSMEEIERVVEYVKGLCTDQRWPPGEFNIPLALGTEKAYPEDETVFKSSVDTKGAGSVMNKLIHEKRFGARNQIEVVVPFGWMEQSGEAGPTGDWAGGVGDLAIGLKRVLFHNINSGTIASFTFETILPTGNEEKGFGKGFTVFEPFVTLGQLLPFESFVQLQTGVEIPTDSDKADREFLFRVALGRTLVVDGAWGRAWSPMVEFLAARELVEGEPTFWDILPQMQVTLNQRQHIMANFGVRLPLTETEGRDSQLVFYLLWDWFDGGFFEGW
jgi:mono/diheme cytochrome c family protein